MGAADRAVHRSLLISADAGGLSLAYRSSRPTVSPHQGRPQVTVVTERGQMTDASVQVAADLRERGA